MPRPGRLRSWSCGKLQGVISTSVRLLRLAALLSARPSWTCAELAERMEVTDRTVRRDIARLRELGYGVESDPGPWGGYRLSVGTRVPPLVLDDEEALAVAVGLREAALSGVLGSDQAALSALLKLRQVLPPRIADRLGEMDAAFVHTPRSQERQIAPGMLLELATVCRRGERVRLSYRDRRDRGTVRDVDPYRLVRAGRRWYLVGQDVARGEWRTFRADRVEQVRSTGHAANSWTRPTRCCWSPVASRAAPTRSMPRFAFRCLRIRRCGWFPRRSVPMPRTAPMPLSWRSADPTRTGSPRTCSAWALPCRC